MLTIQVTPESARKNAKDLKKYLETQNIEIKLSQAQEAVARIFRHKDWNRLIANIKNNDAQAPSILADTLSTNLNNTSSGDVRVTLRIKDINDKKDRGNANISDIYFALKSFLIEHRIKFNRIYIPDEGYQSLSDVEIFSNSIGKCNMSWLKLIFGSVDKYVYVKPKELDIFIPSLSGEHTSSEFPMRPQSEEYTYLRLETEMLTDNINSSFSMPLFSNVVDYEGLLMSDDHYIESLPLYKLADDSIGEHHIKKRYNKGTFLIEPFDSYLHESHKIHTFVNEHTQTHSMSNSDYRNYVSSAYIKYITSQSKNTSEYKHPTSNDNNIKWYNTSVYGPIIPLGYRNKS